MACACCALRTPVKDEYATSVATSEGTSGTLPPTDTCPPCFLFDSVLAHKVLQAGKCTSVPSQRDPTLSAAAGAYMAGRLRLVWLDASAQRHVCRWLVGADGGGALRPDDVAAPPGVKLTAADRAALTAAARAAAANRVCCRLRGITCDCRHCRPCYGTQCGSSILPAFLRHVQLGTLVRVRTFWPCPDASSQPWGLPALRPGLSNYSTS